jgi:hypothetical protein
VRRRLEADAVEFLLDLLLEALPPLLQGLQALLPDRIEVAARPIVVALIFLRPKRAPITAVPIDT